MLGTESVVSNPVNEPESPPPLHAESTIAASSIAPGFRFAFTWSLLFVDRLDAFAGGQLADLIRRQWIPHARADRLATNASRHSLRSGNFLPSAKCQVAATPSLGKLRFFR